MEQRVEKNRFCERVKEILDEIERHRWLESEKVGHDIGRNSAALEWMCRHYSEWKKARGYA